MQLVNAKKYFLIFIDIFATLLYRLGRKKVNFMNENLLTIAQTAEYLQCSQSTIQKQNPARNIESGQKWANSQNPRIRT